MRQKALHIAVLVAFAGIAASAGTQPTCGRPLATDPGAHTPSYYDLNQFKYSLTLGGALIDANVSGYPAVGTKFYWPPAVDGTQDKCPVTVEYIANVANYSVFQLNTSYGTQYAVISDGQSPAHMQLVTTAGTSGAGAPTWNHSGGTTSSGTVVFTDLGALNGIGATPTAAIDYVEKQTMSDDDRFGFLGASGNQVLPVDLQNGGLSGCMYSNNTQLLSNGAGSVPLSGPGSKYSYFLHSPYSHKFVSFVCKVGSCSGKTGTASQIYQYVYNLDTCRTSTWGGSSFSDANISGGQTDKIWQVADLPIAISNVALTSNVVTITTTAETDFQVGDSVTVAAVTNTAVNGAFTVASTPTAYSFTYSLTHADIGSTADTGSVTPPAGAITFFDAGGGENSLSEDGKHMIADFRCNGQQTGCGHNIHVFDVFAHTAGPKLDVNAMVTDVCGAVDPTLWNADQMYVNQAGTLAFGGGTVSGCTASSNYIYAWDATTGHYLYKVGNNANTARGHIIWRTNIATGHFTVFGGGWGSTANAAVLGYTDLESGTPTGTNPTRVDVLDLRGGGDPSSGTLVNQNWFYWSFDGHGGSYSSGASSPHSGMIRNVTDAGSTVSTENLTPGTDTCPPYLGCSSWGNGVKNIRTPTALDIGHNGSRSSLLSDWATYYGHGESSPNLVPVNAIVFCDEESSPIKCWNVGPSYNHQIYNKDCGNCANLSPSGRYYTMQSDLGDVNSSTGIAHLYYLRVDMTPPDTTPPTVSVTAPPASPPPVSGTQTVTASCTDDVAVHDVQFKLDGGNLGGDQLGAGPGFSMSWDTTLASNGNHTLTAVCADTSSNSTTSAGVVVNVQNGLAKPEYFGPAIAPR